MGEGGRECVLCHDQSDPFLLSFQALPSSAGPQGLVPKRLMRRQNIKKQGNSIIFLASLGMNRGVFCKVLHGCFRDISNSWSGFLRRGLRSGTGFDQVRAAQAIKIGGKIPLSPLFRPPIPRELH
jgi:hypothetical protein